MARFLVGVPIAYLAVHPADDGRGRPIDDTAHLTLGFEDGSTAAIHYLANGSGRYPKKRVEAFSGGKTARIETWRRLRTWGLGRWDGLLPRRMDKGHEAEIEAFAAAVYGDAYAPGPLDEIAEVSEWLISAAELARGRSDRVRGSSAGGRSA